MSNNKNNKVIVGKIYADWCGHCTAMAPEWEKMKQKIEKQSGGQTVEFKEIESQQESAGISEINTKINPTPKLESKGYPTLFAIRGGKLSYYEGERTAEKMSEWYLNKQSAGKKNKITRKNTQIRKTQKTNKKSKTLKSFFRFLW